MVAKGHHFAGVALAAVVDADTGLGAAGLPRRGAHVPAADPARRAQRPRRAGPRARPDLPARRARDRASRRGTTSPGFLAGELERRRELGYPPFRHLVRDRRLRARAGRAACARCRSCKAGLGGRRSCSARRRSCACAAATARSSSRRRTRPRAARGARRAAARRGGAGDAPRTGSPPSSTSIRRASRHRGTLAPVARRERARSRQTSELDARARGAARRTSRSRRSASTATRCCACAPARSRSSTTTSLRLVDAHDSADAGRARRRPRRRPGRRAARRRSCSSRAPTRSRSPLVNPALVERERRAETDEEGCLSLQGVLVPVERRRGSTLEGKDPQGEDVRLELEGLAARVVQHELDHLDGVLIIDRTDDEARREALRLRRCRPAARVLRSVRLVRIGVAATAPLRRGRARAPRGRHDVAFLLTRPDAPRGRGRSSRPPPAKEVAERLGIPVLQPERPADAELPDDGRDRRRRLRAADPGVAARAGAVAERAPVAAAALARRRAGRARDHGRRRGDRRDDPRDGEGARRGADRGAARVPDRGGGRRGRGLRARRRSSPPSCSTTCCPRRGSSRSPRTASPTPRRSGRRTASSTSRDPEQAVRTRARALAAHRRPRRAPRPPRDGLARARRGRGVRAATRCSPRAGGA